MTTDDKILKAAPPSIDEIMAGMGSGIAPEKLRGTVSLDYLHRLLAGLVVGMRDGPLRRIAELEQRIEAMEQHGVRFCGTWQRSVSYRKGSVVVADGGAWVALRNTLEAEMPGKTPDGWQLASKSMESAALKTLDLRLEKKIIEAQAAAAKAVNAAAAIAKRAATRAEASVKARRNVEKTTVTRHDESGRIAEFQREIVEVDSE